MPADPFMIEKDCVGGVVLSVEITVGHNFSSGLTGPVGAEEQFLFQA
jgi:hypothetical protein